MTVTNIDKPLNEDAIEMLETAIARLKSGDLRSVTISWVDRDNSIGGDVSTGDNNILMWAAIEHTARSFYRDHIDGN